MEKKMDKTLVIKFPNISTLAELHDKMNKTKACLEITLEQARKWYEGGNEEISSYCI